MPQAAAFVGGMFGFGAGAAFGIAGGATFGSWVAGAAFSGTLLGGLTVKLLSTVAISALSRALAPDPEQGGGITISTTVRGEDNPETIILGRYATGGQALCPPYSHGPSNRYLTHVIELCSAPGAQLDRIMLGDEWVELGSTLHPDYGRPVLGEKYGGHVWVKYLDGSQTTADPMMRAKYGSHPERPWTADMIGKGLCLAILTFYYDQEKLPQVPRYRFELVGIPIYDIRKDSTAGGDGTQRLANPATWAPSHNPIVLAWNIMRGIALPGGDIWGGNISDLRGLPQAVWVAGMNRCDTLAEGDDGPEPMYRAGLEVVLTQAPASALEELFKACSAVIADLGYGWGINVGAPPLPVYSITDEDIIVSAKEELDPFPSLQDTWNAVTAKFPDPERFWETKEAPQRTNAEWEAADTFGRRMATLSLPAVPYPAQVQRLTQVWLQDERRFLILGITLPPDSAHVELIDTLMWTSDHNGYAGKTFALQEIVEDPFTGLRLMSIREVDPGDWVVPPDYILPSPPAPPPPAPSVATVDGFNAAPTTMLDGASKARRAGIRISWSPDIDAAGLRWRLRLSGQSETVLHGTIQSVGVGYVDVFEGVLPATGYDAQAELIADRPTLPTAWLPVTTPDVRLSMAELDAAAQQRVEDLETWMGTYPGDVANALAGLQVDYEAAEAAAAAAETARDLALGHKNAAEAAQGHSEAAQTASEAAQGAAETARTQAQTHATNAGNSASAAAGSASTASTKATEAGNSATAADSSATAANTARGQAEAFASNAASAADGADASAAAAAASGVSAAVHAAQMFPATIGDGSAWTDQAEGAPEDVPTLTPTAGAVEVPVDSIVLSRGTKGWLAGRKYRVTVEAKLSDPAQTLCAAIAGLTDSYQQDAGLGIVSEAIPLAPSTDWQTASGIVIAPAAPAVITRARVGVLRDAGPHPLTAYAGLSAGQVPILADMLWPGGHVLGDDAGTPVVTSLLNMGGTGPYHGMAADSVATAPRFDDGAMLFREGDLLRILNEADLNGVHLLAEVRFTKPAANEYQHVLKHSSDATGTGLIRIWSNATGAQMRWQINRVGSANGGWSPRYDAGHNQWVVWEMRVAPKPEGGQGHDFRIAFNGVPLTEVGEARLGGGYTFPVNLIGNTIKSQRVGAMVSVVTDPGHGMDNPEPAVLAARNYLVGRRA